MIAGDRDTFVDPANSRRAFEALRRAQADATHTADARFVLMTDVGHLPHEEAPDAFANEVYRFLDTVPSANCDV